MCVYVSTQRGDAEGRLAISDFNSGDIHIYDVRSGNDQPIRTLKVRADTRTRKCTQTYARARDCAIHTTHKAHSSQPDGLMRALVLSTSSGAGGEHAEPSSADVHTCGKCTALSVAVRAGTHVLSRTRK